MTLRFMDGGGAMGAMLRNNDWSASPLGRPQDWPQALKAIVGVMLSAPQPMFVVWGQAQLMLYNDAYTDILGGHHPALGKPFAEVWSEVIADVGPIMARAYAGQPTYMDDIGLVLQRHGHAEEAHFSFFYTPVRGEDGDVEGVFCACTEITAQVAAARERQAELSASHAQAQVLRESEEKFRTFAQAVPNHVWTAPADGLLDWFNDQTLAYSGLQPAALMGVGWVQLVHPDDTARAAAAWTTSLANGVNYEIEFRIRRHDGAYRWHLVRALPIRNAAGDVVRWIGTNTDIDDQRADREALLALNATLERRVDERTREHALAQEQLRQAQKMEAIGQLTGGIAHDFNNMLASIYGSIQLMQRKLKTGKTDDFGKLLERASTSAQRAAALTQRLLAFARRQSLDITRVDVAKLVSSLEDMFERTLGPRIALQTGFGAGLWCARIDVGQLENALLNLVINARDAMPDGGQLTISANNAPIDSAQAAREPELEAGDYVELSVADTGAGMPASVIARAFEPFFTTKPIGQGTGLGLSMVYGFVKQAGGHVRITSETGRGTTVRLYLPRDLGGDEAVEAVTNPPAISHAGAGETILVVEDEASVRAVIVAVLEDLGYSFVEAVDADAALAILDAGRHIDLLVTDVGLPGMNGRQLAEIACEKRPDLKVLFVTGYAEQAAVRNGFLTARMQMITKPFAIDELARLIRAIIQGTVTEPMRPGIAPP